MLDKTNVASASRRPTEEPAMSEMLAMGSSHGVDDGCGERVGTIHTNDDTNDIVDYNKFHTIFKSLHNNNTQPAHSEYIYIPDKLHNITHNNYVDDININN